MSDPENGRKEVYSNLILVYPFRVKYFTLYLLITYWLSLPFRPTDFRRGGGGGRVIDYVDKNMGLHETLIRPVLCCESATWTLTQTTEHALSAFERKKLIIYGPVQVEGH
jgi:hypothetical protein